MQAALACVAFDKELKIKWAFESRDWKDESERQRATERIESKSITRDVRRAEGACSVRNMLNSTENETETE